MKDSISREEALRLLEKFHSLPLDRKVDIFRDLSPEAREELVDTAADPAAIVRRISEEEMYFTIKRLGEASAPTLISLTTGRQLTYILDLDLWNKDMFNTNAAGRWLHTLARIGEAKILQFIQVSDPELVVTAIKPFMRVHVRNPDVDLLEQQDSLPPFTIDDTFYVEFTAPDLEDTMKSLLDAIFGWNQLYYFGLMEQLVQGVSQEDEEMALKWRKARLADKGFPDFDEAVQIYQCLGRESISGRQPDEREETAHSDQEPRPLLAYPLKAIGSDTLFRKVLNELRDTQEQDRLTRELAHMANKVMIADDRDPESPEELSGSLRKVSGYINIALEEVCGQNVAEAADILKSNHMELLFRRGFTLILELRKEAQRLLRDYEGGVENLGYPLAGIVNGLLRKRPVYSGKPGRSGETGEFEHLDEIQSIKRLMNKTTIEESWESI